MIRNVSGIWASQVEVKFECASQSTYESSFLMISSGFRGGVYGCFLLLAQVVFFFFNFGKELLIIARTWLWLCSLIQTVCVFVYLREEYIWSATRNWCTKIRFKILEEARWKWSGKTCNHRSRQGDELIVDFPWKNVKSIKVNDFYACS